MGMHALGVIDYLAAGLAELAAQPHQLTNHTLDTIEQANRTRGPARQGMHVNFRGADWSALVLDAATGERRDERLTHLVAHHLGDAPSLQRPTDFRHDNQRAERRLL